MGFLFIAFAVQLVPYYGLISFLLSLARIEPFIISEYNTALLTNYFMHGSQNCLKYFLWPIASCTVPGLEQSSLSVDPPSFKDSSGKAYIRAVGCELLVVPTHTTAGFASVLGLRARPLA